MPKATIDKAGLNTKAELPFELRISDFENAMQDVYDFFHDVNSMLLAKGLQRLDDMTRPAAMSGMISDMITSSLARFSRSLVPNTHFNGHPDLVVRGRYTNNGVPEGTDGIEIKSTRKEGGAVDTHGARDQWMCVFVYEVDTTTEPASDRKPMQFTEVYLGQVVKDDFRKNPRKTDTGTRTATLHKEGIAKLRGSWIYRTESMAQRLRKEKADKKTAERLAAKQAKAVQGKKKKPSNP